MLLWEKGVSLLIRENLSSFEYFQRHRTSGDIDRLFSFITAIIKGLPWFYRVPVMFLSTFTALVDMICLKGITDHMKNLPAFGMLNKLVRATSFLALFDAYPEIFKDK